MSLVKKREGLTEEQIREAKEQKERKIKEWTPSKIALAHNYIENEETQKKRGLVRGAVHLCQFGENIGSEQNEERPVIVISNDTINANSGNVLVIPLTKTLKKKKDRNGKVILTKTRLPIPRYDSHYFLFKKKYDFLDYDSAAKVEETTSVSKIRIGQHLGTIDDPKDLQRLEVRVRWVFGLQ